MNTHLKLVREFHDAFSFPQAEHGANVRLSEMDIIMRQALLMEEGSELLKAINSTLSDYLPYTEGRTSRIISYCFI